MEILDDDNYNLEKLNKNKMIVIKSVRQLNEALKITEKQEKLFFYSNNRKNYLYKTKFVPKKHNIEKLRKLEIPVPELKIIQSALNNTFFSRFKMTNSAYAYVKGRGIVDNASVHLNAKTLIKFDIENFFGSITKDKIIHQLRIFGYGNQVSNQIARICTNGDDVLPQGAPTSPTISNLICINLDKRLAGYAEVHHYNYSRYADDITFSSNVRLKKGDIFKIYAVVGKVLEDNGFMMNKEKFKFFFAGQKMSVTGIIVNDKLSVDKRRIRELENAIRYISIFGLYGKDGHIGHLEKLGIEKSNYKEHLYGIANYIHMIDREKGMKYLSELNALEWD